VFYLCNDSESENDKEVNNLIEPIQILNVEDLSDLSQYTLTCTDSELMPQTDPIIHVYSKEGELLDTHNLANEEYIAETLEFTAQFYRNVDNSNRTVVLFNDVSLFSNGGQGGLNLYAFDISFLAVV
jgi:hypothetical protein